MSLKNLVIVESPAKAKTIEKYLGEGFVVKSSMGHIRDLSSGDSAIDTQNGFKPKYEVPPEKKKLVKELKEMAKLAETVWLASDEDREGEAISWHLFEVLELNETNTKRIVFNEITKTAIQKAIANPRSIDKFLVDAQQARRVLDRLVGFELSPVLWRKVKPSLSAGRVQSVAVKLVVEREREIQEFESGSEYKITGEFETSSGKMLKAEGSKKYKQKEGAKAFLESLVGELFAVSNLEVKPTFRNPSPPFTTSTLQQEASRKLGMDVTTTMRIAQKLYENGHITYMRTDSVNLSAFAISAATNAVNELYGAKYSKSRNFSTKSESAQEAHEAIRPTNFMAQVAGDDPREQKLYQLIWKRSIASQMATAELEKTTITLQDNSKKSEFYAEGEVIKFDGFLKVYMESKDDEEEEDGESSGVLPAVSIGESMEVKKIVATERFAKPAPRYTEASLVKKLEELGIGRPSTYAPTITTIQKRNYVQLQTREGKERSISEVTLKEGQVSEKVKTEKYGFEKNKLFPTDIGSLVTDFLTENFQEILNYGFTAAVEKEFDEIAQGKKGWQEMLEGFYQPFHSTVENALVNSQRVTGERILGSDPISGRQLSVRMGNYGPFAQIGTKEDGGELRYAKLGEGQTLETISVEDALKLFELPKTVATYEGEPVIANVGRYGPYLKIGEKYINVEKGTDLHALTEDDAMALVTAAMSGTQYPINLGEYNGAKIEIMKGRYGPYIPYGGQFVSIPKNVAPEDVTLEAAIKLVDAKISGVSADILKSFTEDASVQILNGRYGPYIKQGKNNIAIPKGTSWENLVWDDIKKMIEESANKPKKAFVRGKKK
jgi:DNA topoisomerase-1